MIKTPNFGLTAQPIVFLLHQNLGSAFFVCHPFNAGKQDLTASNLRLKVGMAGMASSLSELQP